MRRPVKKQHTTGTTTHKKKENNKKDDNVSKMNGTKSRVLQNYRGAEWEYAARGGSKSRGYKYAGGNGIGQRGLV
jgi:hypothetical protein